MVKYMQLPTKVRLLSSLILTMLGSVLAVATARGQVLEPLVSDRPDFTESAAVVGSGSLQLEAGYTFRREGAERANSAGEVLIRAGLAAWAELRVGLNSFSWLDGRGRDSSGFEDVFLGAKLGLLPASGEAYTPRPQIALLVGTTVPTGSDGFGSHGAQPEAKLALAWSLGDRLAVGSNLNVASLSGAGDRFGQISGGVAVGLALDSRVGSYGVLRLLAGKP